MSWTLSCLELRFTRQDVKEDRVLVHEDWEENIVPLTSLLPENVDPGSFGIREYLAAKSLIASRSFEIDDYHGWGMVPLADLFNHKTGEEDVHFTAELPHGESDSEPDETDNSTDEDEPSTKNSASPEQSLEGENTDEETIEEEEEEETTPMLQDDVSSLEMIMVKNVPAGAEVYNTYGLIGNAALLHRYGFTELDNLYNIVNIDLDLVTEWSTSSYTTQYTRARLALFRKLGYNSDYFEVSPTGESETELLMLLNILLLPDDAYNKLDLALTGDCISKEGREITIGKHKVVLGESCSSSDVLLTDDGVCEALLAIVDKRESLYGTSSSLEEDVVRLGSCVLPKDRRLYHSLVLRVSERRILEKLRSYVREKVGEVNGGKRRKKMMNSKP
ncbi:N-lysine methyltransferase [Hirschfeldia incana]|nr:N-lysine methyltransferase [Hirschfeldia incana]